MAWLAGEGPPEAAAGTILTRLLMEAAADEVVEDELLSLRFFTNSCKCRLTSGEATAL